MIYGDTQFFYDNSHSAIIRASSNNHKYSHRFVHQSAFIYSQIMKQYHYDTSFKIAGDTDFFTKIFNKGYVFKKIDAIVAIYDTNGVSGTPSFQMLKEDARIAYQYNRLYPLFLGARYIFYVLPKFFIRCLLPKSLTNKLRILLNKNTR